MKLLADLFPVLLFFVAYQLYDIYVATLVAIVAAAIQVAYYKIRHGKVENVQLITLALLVVFGGLTLFLRDPTFTVFAEVRSLRPMPDHARSFLRRPELLVISKAERRSTVHRPVHLDAVATKVLDHRGVVVGQRLFVGLFMAFIYLILFNKRLLEFSQQILLNGLLPKFLASMAGRFMTAVKQFQMTGLEVMRQRLDVFRNRNLKK